MAESRDTRGGNMLKLLPIALCAAGIVNLVVEYLRDGDTPVTNSGIWRELTPETDFKLRLQETTE
jgi:hypothetical protein